MYGLHLRWFKISREAFDARNWAGIAVYKLGIILLNPVPLVALYLSAPAKSRFLPHNGCSG